MKIDSNKGTSTSTAELNNRKESYYWILEQKTTTKQYEKNNNNNKTPTADYEVGKYLHLSPRSFKIQSLKTNTNNISQCITKMRSQTDHANKRYHNAWCFESLYFKHFILTIPAFINIRTVIKISVHIITRTLQTNCYKTKSQHYRQAISNN